MLKNYLKIAVRNLLKHWFYSLINVLGLAIGMACCILILLFLREEMSYDRFHDKHEQIYRVTTKVHREGQATKHTALTPPAVTPALAAEFPEVVASVGFVPYYEAALPGKVAVSFRENRFNEQFFWVRESLFGIFSFDLISGNPETALVDPYSVVITEDAALRFFGGEDPMGKVVSIDSGYSEEDYKVTGVIRDVPESSHIHFTVLASYSTLDNIEDERINTKTWWTYEDYTYVLLGPNVSVPDLEAKFNAFTDKYAGPDAHKYMGFELQPITDIHLRSKLLNEVEVNSDISYVYILLAVAFLTLFIACVNFTNLATARSASRAKEVGMRKVVGAHRSQIIGQFLGESLLLAALALLVALFIVQLSLPAYSNFVDRDIGLHFDGSNLLGLLAVVVLVGVLAGSYPALFLSAFRPLQVLRGISSSGSSNTALRKILVVTQFVISVFLIICTMGIFDQLRYMKSFDTGIEKEQVVVVPVRDITLRDKYDQIKRELDRSSSVVGTTLTSLVLGKELPQIGTQLEGTGERKILGALVVDHDFVNVFDLEILAGRNFSKENPRDITESFILSESSLSEYGWETPEEAIGQRMVWGNWKVGPVIGVVEDFHYQPLRFAAKPFLLHIRPIAFHYLLIRIAPGDPSDVLVDLEEVWRKAYPDRPFDYSFLDQEFDRLYRTDEKMGQVFGFFSVVAIFVACLGLLGLAAFTVEQRTKEVGIRKALGATVKGIALLISKDFTRLVLLAVMLAWPLAYFFLEDWLQNFAYRAGVDPLNFFFGGLGALFIAWLTVSFQAVRAALANPADALRFE